MSHFWFDIYDISVTLTQIRGKKLDRTKNYKLFVVAYKKVNGKLQRLGKTIVAHVVGNRNKVNTNVSGIKLQKNKVKLPKGKSYTIVANVKLVDSKKQMLSDGHAPTFRYKTTNKTIATVSKNGKITAKAKGTCYIYVYAKNGYAKKVKVTVK